MKYNIVTIELTKKIRNAEKPKTLLIIHNKKAKRVISKNKQWIVSASKYVNYESSGAIILLV